MQFTYSNKLATLLPDIEEFLVSKTPVGVEKLHILKPVYAVFLWYDDSCAADDFVPDFGVGTETLRSACSQKHEDRNQFIDCIWRPQQTLDERIPGGKFKDRAFISQCNEAFQLMMAANQTGMPLEDEGELLRPFRSMMHRVAARLNEHEWSGQLKTVEEFVVVSVDRIGNWLAEDLRNSIPKEKLELLQRRGLILDSK